MSGRINFNFDGKFDHGSQNNFSKKTNGSKNQILYYMIT